MNILVDKADIVCVQVDSGETIYQLPAAKQGNGNLSILQEPVRDMQSFCTCDKLKWQTVLLCKNANSSLVLSKCIEDGNVPSSEGADPHSEIWRSTNHRKDYLAACVDYDAVEEKQDYKHFIVLRDPVDRFVSYANWHAACNAYLRPVIQNASHETSLMVLFVLWMHTQDPGEGAKYPRLFDAHARLQSVSVATAKKVMPNVDWELVPIHKLNGWYKDSFGSDLYTNNVGGRIFTREEVESAAFYPDLITILEPDIELWRSVAGS